MNFLYVIFKSVGVIGVAPFKCITWYMAFPNLAIFSIIVPFVMFLWVPFTRARFYAPARHAETRAFKKKIPQIMATILYVFTIEYREGYARV